VKSRDSTLGAGSLLSKLIKTSAQAKFFQRGPKDPALPGGTIAIGQTEVF